MAAAASPPPSAGRSHPTYKEMVVQALTELREPGGSSRDAISKYIADHFSGLPARHDDLLSVHLRRLRSQGLLLMSGYSYLLPSASNPPRRGRGRPRKTTLSPPGQKRGKRADLSTSAPFQGVKRGPGRPPKNTTPVAASGGVKRGPGRPRKNPIPMSLSVPHISMPAVKRGRGRPPKNAQILTAASESITLVAIATTPLLKRRPSKSVMSNIVTSVRRGRGHPPKVLLPAYSSIPFPAAPSLVAGMRKRGRPPKEKRPPGSPRNDKPESVQSVALTTRGPGRPRKERTLGGGHLEAGLGAQHQAADRASDVRNGGEVRHSPSSGTSSTEKRGRGRPRKRPLGTETTETGVAALAEKRGPGRPRKKIPSVPLSLETQGIAMSGYKRGRGRPRKENPSAGIYAETGIVASMGNKRGCGRPRKERSLGGSHLKAGVEAQPQAAGQAGDVRNGGEVRHLPSSGTSSTEKRGRGRPRKRPWGTETTEIGVDALVEKRGPGRPRKKNPSAPLSLETEGIAMSGYKRGRGRPRKRPLETETTEKGVVALVEKRGPGRPRKKNPSTLLSLETEGVARSGYKRGRGRPRKDVSFGTESAEAAVEVSRDLAESKPKKEDHSVLGNKTETESILSGAGMEVTPTDTGGTLVSGEKASTAHVEAEGAVLGVDPIISNLDVDNRSL